MNNVAMTCVLIIKFDKNENLTILEYSNSLSCQLKHLFMDFIKSIYSVIVKFFQKYVHVKQKKYLLQYFTIFNRYGN